MNYTLIIPSHRRSFLLFNKTWSLLQRTGVILKDVIIWVNDDQDFEIYSTLFPPEQIRKGGSSISEKRNLIQEAFPLDSNIVMIDDDIDEIYVLKENSKKVVLKDFNKLVEMGFSYCEKENCSLWGVYPIDSPLCMKPFVRKNLSYIVAALFGMVNKRIPVEFNYAEDFERSIKFYLLEGKVIRLEFVGLLTKYYTTPGGIQTTRTETSNYNSKKSLVDKYPDHAKLVYKRDRAEIKLIGKKDVINVDYNDYSFITK